MSKFILSFRDGICRLSNGKTLDAAKDDARNAIAATGRYDCNILDEDYKIVATVNSNDGSKYHQQPTTTGSAKC